MKNEQSLWPFGFNRSNSPYFIGAAILILALLLLIDGFVTVGVDGLPEQIIAPFKIITRAGNSDWILISTLLGTIIGLIGSKLKTFSKIKQKAHLVFIYSFLLPRFSCNSRHCRQPNKTLIRACKAN